MNGRGSAPAKRAAAKDKTRGAPRLAGQLKAPTRGKIHRRRFAYGGGDARTSQGLLENRQGLSLIPNADLDQALGGKAQAHKARRIEVIAPHDPHHGAPDGQGRSEGGHESPGRRACFRLETFARRFVPTS